MGIETIKVGKRGTIVIPAGLRRNYAIEEGSLLNAEPCEDGVFLRPVAALPIEIYTPERKAEFLLNSAITREDYIWATKEVSKMGIDPETILHKKPEDL
jgi:AbrB family looped-hinge helix DNA binding protein